MGLSKKRTLVTALGAVGAVAILAGAALVILLVKNVGVDPPPPFESELGQYENAAISCDAPLCAAIGKEVLEKNGTVADAAIATLLCMGVTHSQSMGIGGGFLMVYYNNSEEKSYTMIARETAPAGASQDMFEGDPELSQTGGLAVAVPGEMKGYWELYKRFGGGVSWQSLFEPTIKLCEEGYPADSHTANALLEKSSVIYGEPSLAEIFVNNETEEVYKEGELIKRPVLAQTLRRIADDVVNGGDLLYQRTSELAQWLIEDLQKDFEGIMTLEDLENYQVQWADPIQVDLHGDFTLHTVPPPGSGVLMAFILRVLNKYELSSKTINAEDIVTSYHLILEAYKHAYAKRTILGDPFGDEEIRDEIEELVKNLTSSDSYLAAIHEKIKLKETSPDYSYYGAEFYQPDDHGTSHMSIIGPDGDAIAITSTVNLYFGAKIRSKRTGIIYNDIMDDFSAPNITNAFGVPPSENNFIKPGKRPLSSMCPSIFTDSSGEVRLVIGSSGGTRITTTNAYVAVRNLWFDEDIKQSIDAKRLHHQLAPMVAEYERGFNYDILDGLIEIGHNVTLMEEGASTMGVARSENGTVWANCDVRKSCSIAGF